MQRQRVIRVSVAVIVGVLSVSLLFAWFGGDPFELRAHSFARSREFVLPLIIAVAIAVLCHAFIRRWLLACIICTVILTLVDLLVSVVSAPLSATPFWVIGLFSIALASFALSAVVGTFFLLFRDRASIT